MKRILVLSSAETEQTLAANKVFCDEISARLGEGVAIEAFHYDDLVLNITTSDMNVELFDTGRSLASYDFVYFKSYYRYSEVALAVVKYLQKNNITYICHELDDAISFSKLTQYARLSAESITIPDTIFMATHQFTRADAAQKIEQTLGFPCIVKAIGGKGGDLNFLVTDAHALSDIARTHEEVNFVVQRFIPNTYDLRVLIGNKSIRLVIKRQRIDDTTHLNNTSQGAAATLVEVSEIAEDVQQMALRAAALFGRDVAGVDVMFNSDTGEAVILEVNASPQVATGAFQSEKLSIYADVFRELLGIDKTV